MPKKFLTPINVVNLSSDPASGTEGDVYYNTVSDKLKIYSNSVWSEIGQGSTVYYQTTAPSSPNVGDVWVDSDEVYTTINPNDYMPKSGGTFTGEVSGITPTQSAHLTTKSYVDGFMPLSGGTFTGAITSPTVSITTADTATAASHYIVETASNGVIRPKTLANARTEIVTSSSITSAVGGTVVGTYSIPDTSSNAGWIRLGTFTAAQNGRTIELKIVSHAGYNADLSQNQTTYLYFKTSNGTSVDSNGFAGDGYYWSVGRNTGAPSQIKVRSNAAGVSATSYDIFAFFSAFNNGSSYTVQVEPNSTWTNTGNSGQADPGVAGNTVAVLTNVGAVINAQTFIANAATTSYPSLRLPHGSAPTSPVNGDIWTTTAGMYVRVNNLTIGPLSDGAGFEPFFLSGM